MDSGTLAALLGFPDAMSAVVRLEAGHFVVIEAVFPLDGLDPDGNVETTLRRYYLVEIEDKP